MNMTWLDNEHFDVYAVKYIAVKLYLNLDIYGMHSRYCEYLFIEIKSKGLSIIMYYMKELLRNRRLGLELCPRKCLAILPIWRGNVEWSKGTAITCGDTKWKCLIVEDGIGLPNLSPITPHYLPPGSCTLHRHCMNCP